MYIFAIFVSYGLQFFIPIAVIIENRDWGFCKVFFLKLLLVLFTCSLAIAIPDLGDFIALIGACASSLLALGNFLNSNIRSRIFFSVSSNDWCIGIEERIGSSFSKKYIYYFIWRGGRYCWYNHINYVSYKRINKFDWRRRVCGKFFLQF